MRTVDEIFHEALTLSNASRVLLVEKLIKSLDFDEDRAGDNIPERELWLWKNKEALVSVKCGIQQAKEGAGKFLGDFRVYGDLEVED